MVESFVNLASEAVCFRSRESVIYLRIPWNDDGHQSVALHDEVGRAWLTALYTDAWRQPPSRAAVSEAIAIISGSCILRAPVVDCPMRVSFQGNPRRPSAIYHDLRSAGYAVEIAASGYRVSVDHTMDFGGGFQQHSLPDPVEPPGPARVLTQFRSLANLADDRAWIRCLLWLLAAFRPAGPYPPAGAEADLYEEFEALRPQLDAVPHR
jgi:hypothetical protein